MIKKLLQNIKNLQNKNFNKIIKITIFCIFKITDKTRFKLVGQIILS